MGRKFLMALTLVASLAGQGVSAMQPTETSVALARFLDKDHFAAESNGLYTGVKDPEVRAALNTSVAATACLLAQARASDASNDEVLTLFQRALRSIDRDALDTEDAERVATVFEQILEAAGLESSEGAINEWMYGLEPD